MYRIDCQLAIELNHYQGTLFEFYKILRESYKFKYLSRKAKYQVYFSRNIYLKDEILLSYKRKINLTFTEMQMLLCREDIENVVRCQVFNDYIKVVVE